MVARDGVVRIRMDSLELLDEQLDVGPGVWGDSSRTFRGRGRQYACDGQESEQLHLPAETAAPVAR